MRTSDRPSPTRHRQPGRRRCCDHMTTSTKKKTKSQRPWSRASRHPPATAPAGRGPPRRPPPGPVRSGGRWWCTWGPPPQLPRCCCSSRTRASPGEGAGYRRCMPFASPLCIHDLHSFAHHLQARFHGHVLGGSGGHGGPLPEPALQRPWVPRPRRVNRSNRVESNRSVATTDYQSINQSINQSIGVLNF